MNPNDEGTTLLEDYSGLKIKWVKTREHLNAVESENVRIAMAKYLGKKIYPFSKWFTIKHIKFIKRCLVKFGHGLGIIEQQKKALRLSPIKFPWK